MPVRGHRSIWPRKPKESQGLFGKKNSKSTAHFPNQGVMKYAHSTSTRTKPAGNGNQSLRHQKPRRDTK